MGDTLNASWLGAPHNPKPPTREDREPVTTYAEADMHYYYLQALYGPQEPPSPRRR